MTYAIPTGNDSANDNDGTALVNGGMYWVPQSVLIGLGLVMPVRIGKAQDLDGSLSCVLHNYEPTEEVTLLYVAVYGKFRDLENLSQCIEVFQEDLAFKRSERLSSQGKHVFSLTS